MATFKLEIKCDNAAFDDCPELEIRRILMWQIAQRIENGEPLERGVAPLFDINGNRVGTTEFIEDDSDDAEEINKTSTPTF